MAKKKKQSLLWRIIKYIFIGIGLGIWYLFKGIFWLIWKGISSIFRITKTKIKENAKGNVRPS